MTTYTRDCTCAKRRGTLLRGTLCLLLCAVVALAGPAHAGDPFVDAVDSFSQGTSGGFGAEALPAVVLGAPRGGELQQGSFDVVSLGIGGAIVLRFDPPVICDGPGADFTVFENAFHIGSPNGPVFAEYGFVAVSQDGEHYVEFPHDTASHAGLAGQGPVLSHPDNGIDPLDPSVSGGDPFDLSSVGLAWAAYVRVTDVAGAIADTGDLPQFAVPPSAGFDLDAVAALHACDPGAMPSASPTASPTPSPTRTVPAPTPTATATPSSIGPAPHHDAVGVGRRPVRLRIRAGQTSGTKRLRVRVRNADAAGDLPIRLSGAGCSAAIVGLGFDRRVNGAEDTAIVRAGRVRAAVVSVVVSSAAIATPDRREAAVCLLTFTASAAVPGNVDPTPGDNTIEVELSVLDLNDVE